MKQPGLQPGGDSAAIPGETKSIAELEGQAAELELKSKELRSRIAALKLKTEQSGQAPKNTGGTAASAGSH